MEKVRRNRVKTTQRIIDAFEEVLAERGLQAVGVNRVAERAGVSKVLIYRYFGGLEGLISHYIRMGRLYPNFTEPVLEQLRPNNEEELSRLWYRQLTQLFRQFRNNKASRELLKANTIENDPIADIASQIQDEEITRLVNQFSFVDNVDNEAISAVTVGAMSYLTLMADNNRTMAGIDLRSEEGWKRIELAVKLIYTALSEKAVQSDAVSFIKAPSTMDIQWK
ncbi:TetR/AcrR family transcriptional regulator [Fibrella forsythiae]|uniref:TetR/AcrR family transcriptional regulator n=1 Tax=Fibrella forsythiae TaxID=2817061 RepID=A0ABS3JL37_9BACT|nr:TetR/AcrR family transcriptional regulator [Fibrella forsythiae]MBO0949934.1 TetR/AcrR family transcriptional regulator [Fibrella forsythiae]